MERKLELYEKKILKDKEFPIQLIVNKCQSKGKYFSAHWHEQIELHYVVRGKTVIRLEQEETVADKGALVIVNSNVLHEGYCRGGEMEVMVVIFDMEDFSQEFADKNIIFRPLISGDDEISRIMLRIHEEYKRKEIGYQLVCKGELLKLVTYLARNDAVEMLSEEDLLKRRKKLERLNTVYQYIENHYAEPITNRELAEMVHLSEGRFCHIFKESAGASPLQYINEIRLNKAMKLLKKGDFTATQAAETVGFLDYNHFGRMFRKYFGCTPLEARKKV
ncbi:AraC family transcriptional regulator [Parablautia muri]|uniref:AraC family transcriptional regulator n=1 Tax=Parablautia muri TaxID=2320879 RepID=A0A9X5GT44_9FIRM|nr:AraC family transcriptional regulator [Parablautia muri]NBJ93611.1 AraC family transcriptional regulator [Parablautia muri]